MPRDNPFYYNLPTQPADFVGRWPLVDEIVADLSKGRADSWAVIGGRRFGKSSVLKAIEWRLMERLADHGQGERHVFPLVVDLKGSETDTEQNVYARIGRLLYRALRRDRVLAVDLAQTDLDTVRRAETLSFYQFEDVFDNLANYFERHCGPLRLALLLDEVEATTRFAWSETLFNQLRALIYDGPLADVVKLVLTGSARVIQVRQAGSPLLNAVKIIHLESLSDTDLQELIARGGEIPDETSKAVQVQSGGHPFIAQCLLHHLWDQDNGLAQATPAQVEQITRQMRQRRAADLRGWWEAIGDSGQRAYALLAKANDWLDERTLLAQIRGTTQPLDQGLAALCYHGLAVRDESGQRYRAVGALFREWFMANVPDPPPGPVPRTITWLHLSDLHFRQLHDYDENIVLKALLRDLSERIHDDGLQPDFIILSGDIAFSGKPTEYDLALSFFDDLLRMTGLPCERLFLVPGNHDVDRNLVSRGAQGIGDSLADRESANAILSNPDDRRLMFARFQGYAAFVNDYLSGHLSFDDEHYFYVCMLELDGQRIALLGLNSAWLSASDEDKANGLLIGERQTRAALKQAEGTNLKIVLLHHPFDWLREFDQNDSAAILLDNCDFVLHGHLHRAAMAQLVSPDSGAMVIAAGACYKTRKYPNSYNFVRLDFTAGTGTVYLRRYSDERGGFWAKDTLTYRNVPDGVYTFALHSRLTSPRSGLQPSSTVIDSPAPQRDAYQPGNSAITANGESVFPSPNLDVMRHQLNQVFDDPGFDAFCLDHFSEVYDKFSRGMRKDEKITLLLDYCRRTSARYQKLLSALKEQAK